MVNYAWADHSKTLAARVTKRLLGVLNRTSELPAKLPRPLLR